MGFPFGLGSVGQFCWSCCGHSCGCNSLMAGLKLEHLKWPYSQVQSLVGRRCWLSLCTWSLFLQQSAPYSLHSEGNILRGWRWKLQDSLKLILAFIQQHVDTTFLGQSKSEGSPPSRNRETDSVFDGGSCKIFFHFNLLQYPIKKVIISHFKPHIFKLKVLSFSVQIMIPISLAEKLRKD